MRAAFERPRMFSFLSMNLYEIPAKQILAEVGDPQTPEKTELMTYHSTKNSSHIF